MPDINEFLNQKQIEQTILKNDRIEKIEGERPCLKCDLKVNLYYFNQEDLEMFWTCPEGHENRYRVG